MQLAAEFRRNVEQGFWVADEKIPSLEELTKSYQVARMTIRNAIGVLESEGLIRRGRGLGTFVEKTRPSIAELQLPSTWDEAVALSDVLGTESIYASDRAIQTLPAIGMKFSGAMASSYRYLCRLHVKDGVPYCFSEVYIAEDIYMEHQAAFKKSAAASVISRIPGLELSEARQKITISGAGLESAKALNLNLGDSVAELRRFASLADRVIYFARLEFPTKFVNMEIDLLRS